MEVGVCVEAYQGGEPLRHINSAFMTFEVLGGDGKQCTLPRIRPEPVVSFQEPIMYSIAPPKKAKLSQNKPLYLRISTLGFTGWKKTLSGSCCQKEDSP